jgi:hypothetical protein
MSMQPFEVAEGEEYNGVCQLSVFLENRLGQLHRLTRVLERAEVRILALSVVYSVDCAIIRLLVDDADEAHRLLSENGFSLTESEVLVVLLPEGKRGILTICSALLAAEVNILYAYPLLPHPDGRPALAIKTDAKQMAADLLRSKGFAVLDQSDLRDSDGTTGF